MKHFALGALVAVFVLAPGLGGAPPDVMHILDNIEQRYNQAKTMQISFVQHLQFQGRKWPPEAGELYLSKPGRMRWEYRVPAGKLFVSDGKDIYFYSPNTRRVEKSKLRESGDFRVPLAFLLGRLDFRRDFEKFIARPDGENVRVRAIPRAKKSPYREVEFLVTPNTVIQEVSVTGKDGSLMQFSFTGEQVNPAVAKSKFQFVMPPGAQLVDVGDFDPGTDAGEEK